MAGRARPARKSIGGHMQCQANTKNSIIAPVAPDILPSLVKLLESVRKEFDADREVAKALLVRAASLLRVEIDRQAADTDPQNKTAGLGRSQCSRLNAATREHRVHA